MGHKPFKCGECGKNFGSSVTSCSIGEFTLEKGLFGVTSVEGLQSELLSHSAPSHPHGREALQVWRAWKGLQPESPVDTAPEGPHGGEAPQMQAVRQGLQPELAVHPAPAHPHWREALPLCRLWQGLQPEVCPHVAPEGAQGKAIPEQKVRPGLRA